MTTVDAGEWVDVTANRANGSERRYRLDVSPEFTVELTVSKSTREATCPYQVVLSTVVESDARHVSDHPVAGYDDRESAREALHALSDVVSAVVAERDDLPDPENRLAHDVIPRFLDQYVNEAVGVCEPLYDQTLHG